MRLSTVQWAVVGMVLANLLVFFWPDPTNHSAAERSAAETSTLVLLEDPEPAAPQLNSDVPEKSEAPEEPEEKQERTARCWLIGPIVSGDMQDLLTQYAERAGLNYSWEARSAAVPRDYWVYVPSNSEKSEIRRLGRALKDVGVDNYPINDGELKGHLSLGLFKQKQRAEAVVEQVSKLGFSAAVLTRQISRQEDWMKLQAYDDTPVREQLGESLSTISLQPIACPNAITRVDTLKTELIPNVAG